MAEMPENEFNFLKNKLSNAPLFIWASLASFDKAVEIEFECDVCGWGISVVLIQDGKHLIYLSEKLNRKH